MELPDPLGSYAVLIGSSSYESPDLEDLPAVSRNLEDLGRLLEDPGVWGLPPDHVTRIAEPSSPVHLLDAVREAARRATDTLLVYYAGHGLVGPGEVDSLLLALPSSDPERPYTSVDFANVRREVLDAGRKVNRVVILDCCYSGQAMTGGMNGPVTMAEQARITGTYLLTACGPNRLAVAPPDEPHTAFTGELIRALSDGLPGAGPLIGATELYEHVTAELRAKGRPIPQQRLSNTGRDLVLGRNRHGLPGGTTAAAPTPRATRLSVSHQYGELLRSQPRRIAEYTGQLQVTDRATAAELLELAAGNRPAQEAAALAHLLRRQGRGREAEAVLTTIGTRRSPADLVTVVRALRALDEGEDVDEDVERLLRTVANRAPEDVAAALRPLYDEEAATADALLAAAIDTLGTTEAVLGLAGALWSAQLDEQATRVLAAPSFSSPQEAVRLADALRSIGRVDEALDLSLRWLPDTAGESAGLIRVLRLADEAGRPAQADELLRAAADAASTVRDLARLCDALWTAGMGDRAERILTLASGGLDTAEVVALAEQLHAQGHDGALRPLFEQAATARPVKQIPALVEALRAMGRPLDAEALVKGIPARRSAASVAALLALLDRDGAPQDSARVLAAVSGDVLLQARLIRALHDVSRPRDALLDELCATADADFPEMLGALHKAAEHEVAIRVLHRLAQTAPERAEQQLPRLRTARMPVDQKALHTILETSGRPVEGTSAPTVRSLTAGGTWSLDQIDVIAVLSHAGLTAQVEKALEEYSRQRSTTQVIELLQALETRGHRNHAQAVVRGARWMFPELSMGFVRSLHEAGLRELARYALENASARLTFAQRRELAESLGIPAPLPDPPPDPPQPGGPRLLDRFRRR
ncbi:caspase, EACC1-associated type [Streptomyces exfoliatus]|uniref:caspase, EACC1-associated type n=1 Tax=Streptomyces exfoliatus TaxID=1905 RepID=UPI003C2D1017